MKKDQFASVKAKVKMQRSASAKTKKQGKDYDSLLLKNLNRTTVSGGKVNSALTGKAQYSKGADSTLSFTERMEALTKRMNAITAEVKARLK